MSVCTYAIIYRLADLEKYCLGSNVLEKKGMILQLRVPGSCSTIKSFGEKESFAFLLPLSLFFKFHQFFIWSPF